MRTWSKEEIRDALRLYAVTDRSWLRERSFKEVLQEALSADGITCVQLREKHAAPEEKETLARKRTQFYAAFAAAAEGAGV